MVLNGHIFGIHQIFEVKEFLRFGNAALGQSCGFCLFVNNIVAVVTNKILNILLGVNLFNSRAFERESEAVRHFIKVGGFFSSARNDERSSRLIDKYGVNLVNDCKVMPALNLVLLVNNHIVPQIVEAHFVVCAVGNVGGIGFLSFGIFFFVNDKSDRQAHKAVNLAHPFAVAAGKIIVDRNDVNAVARKRVKISGQGCNKGFALARFHLGNSALMQNDAADNLNGEMLQAEHAPRSLAAGGKRFGENIVKRFAVCKAGFEFGRFCLKLLIGQRAGHVDSDIRHVVAPLIWWLRSLYHRYTTGARHFK